MDWMSNFNAAPTPVLLAALVTVAALLLLSRWLLPILALCAVAVVAWNLDLTQHLDNVRRYAETHIPMPLDQIHLAQFCVGLLVGLIVFSTVLFVRAFAQATLVAATVAIAYVLGTEAVPGLMRHAAMALHLLQEFDAFAKGAALGKFVAGLIKWRQIRRRGRSPA